MSEITLSLPDQTCLALKLPPEAIGPELRLAAAVKLYELGRLNKLGFFLDPATRSAILRLGREA